MHTKTAACCLAGNRVRPDESGETEAIQKSHGPENQNNTRYDNSPRSKVVVQYPVTQYLWVHLLVRPLSQVT